MQIKHKKNIRFWDARKIVGSYMGESTNTPVARSVDPITQSNQVSKFWSLVEKLIQLERKDWPKFQEQLKNLHSAELQILPRGICTNKDKPNDTIKGKKQTNSTAQIQTTLPKNRKITSKMELSQISNPSTYF